MSDNIESLAKHTNDGTKQSPKQCLESALEDIGKHGALKDGKKVMVITLGNHPW